MNFDEYQKETLRTASRDIKAYGIPKDIEDAIVSHCENYFGYEERDVEYARIFEQLLKKHDQMIWSLGLTGESGEFADIMKKHHGHGHKLDYEKAASELGDILWYVSVLADSLGFSLCDIAGMNINKLRKRYPDGFTSEMSKNRKL